MGSESDPSQHVEWVKADEAALEAIVQPGDQESGFETLAYTAPEDREGPTVIDADEFYEGLNDPEALAQNRRIYDWMRRGSPVNENPWGV